MKAFSELLNSAKASRFSLPSAIEDVRNRIADLTDQRRDVELQRPPKEVALARLNAWIEYIRGGDAHLDSVSPFLSATPNRVPNIMDRGVFALPFIAPLIANEFTAEIERRYETCPGISDGSRAETLAKLDQELVDLQLTEESLIRLMEVAGQYLARRQDAIPAIVLAADEVLP